MSAGVIQLQRQLMNEMESFSWDWFNEGKQNKDLMSVVVTDLAL